MRVISGGLLLLISLFGYMYFRHYRGTVIPYPALWYLLFILLGIFGFLLISGSVNKSYRRMEDSDDLQIQKFIENADKIQIDFDRCEFKGGSYSHQVEDPNMSSVKWIMPGTSATLADTTTTENVEQSYVIYNYTVNGNTERFISHYFPFSADTLKFYVVNNNIILYVDRFDRKHYYFNLTR